MHALDPVTPLQNSESSVRNSVTSALALIIGFVYTLLLLPPWIPTFLTAAEYRDPSWQYMLHEGFAKQLEFGREIVFTYGPLGFLTKQMYHPQTFNLMLGIWVGLSILYFAVTWTMSRRYCQSPWTALLLTMLAVRVVFVDSMIFFFSFVVLLVSWRLFQETAPRNESKSFERGRMQLTVLLLIVVGLLPLTKYTFVPAVLFVLTVIAGIDLQQRRWPWHTITALTTMVLAWTACGQPLSGLSHYLGAGFEVASKYVDAMTNWETESFDIAMVLLGAGLIPLIPLGVRISFDDDRRWLSVAYPVVFFTLMFLVFKFTFVGYHGHKLSIFYASAFLVALYSLLATRGSLSFLHRRHVVTTSVSGLLFVIAVVSAYARYIETDHSVVELAALGNPQNPSGLRAWLRKDPWMSDRYLDHFEDIRSRYPLPDLQGTVDVVPDQLAIGIAGRDVKFVPRPLLHTYATHSPWLAEQNAAHYRSKSAPDNVIFKVDPLIGRYPTLNDGRLWLELIRSYDVDRDLGENLLLCRRETNRTLEQQLLKSVQTSWNQEVSVPEAMSGVIWCRVRIRRNNTGRLAAFAYKLPEIQMDVSHAGGTRTYRFTAASGESGFILSPRIEHRSQLAELLSTGNTIGKPNRRPAVAVRSIRFHTSELAQKYFYNAGISIDFEHVAVAENPELVEQTVSSFRQ